MCISISLSISIHIYIYIRNYELLLSAIWHLNELEAGEHLSGRWIAATINAEAWGDVQSSQKSLSEDLEDQ